MVLKELPRQLEALVVGHVRYLLMSSGTVSTEMARWLFEVGKRNERRRRRRMKKVMIAIWFLQFATIVTMNEPLHLHWKRGNC
jgi:hypothetical protein